MNRKITTVPIVLIARQNSRGLVSVLLALLNSRASPGRFVKAIVRRALLARAGSAQMTHMSPGYLSGNGPARFYRLIFEQS